MKTLANANDNVATKNRNLKYIFQKTNQWWGNKKRQLTCPVPPALSLDIEHKDIDCRF